MKYAFTAKGESWDSEIDPRLGRTEFILIYDDKKNELSAYSNSEITQQAHGAGPLTVQKIIDLNPDILITGNGPGKNAAEVMSTSEIKIITGAGDMKIKEALEAYKSDKITG
ncbi:MAG: dinitrogenase iron-molybdenum cofactor biosynthesis protein [Candidatus Marinimicrobia bacterium]|nr:dinitrogenase iron-molybdenum cofactor biosynthesis protein [Candidatus Neomarinimicrobiota bacterium]MBT4361735.1 dinitrogenase iron-molybdenum cofactor biosynthesis protein [Candidatus Neomarinimicrobiota bacterium]MBT4715873.1 dinitrogenase iron-molybdenum cofactor biosynthesis protein [Candidatus Neomarinimicrobiota bacterium]MBT4947786.1 dinitrogenase iron-molybdenum cofactor biosynthesis protein [Candidatus Neomarinimicrobiota bacterium]MBT5271273.1 dinitrogenase iron-molybdenum cofact